MPGTRIAAASTALLACVVSTQASAQALTVNLGVRLGLDARLDGAYTRLTFFDGLTDQLRLRPSMAARLVEHVRVAASLDAGTKSGVGGVVLLDAMVQLELADALQIWAGQHLFPQDRNGLSGPFYTNSWNYALEVPTYPFDQGGRDRGVTVWGLLARGLLKYHVTAVDLQPGRELRDARVGARLTISLLAPEKRYGFWGTYYGQQDTLSLGVAAQYQRGSGKLEGADRNLDGRIERDFTGFSADLFFEKRLPSVGTLTLDGGYWDFDRSGADYVANQGTKDAAHEAYGPLPGRSGLASVSWLAPRPVGPGSFQINARYQGGRYREPWREIDVLDAGLSYVVDGFMHRWYLNYRTLKRGDAREHSVQLGAQLQLTASS